MKRSVTEGYIPVRGHVVSLQYLPSNVEHVKFGMNPGRPLSKTKYFYTSIAYSTVRER